MAASRTPRAGGRLALALLAVVAAAFGASPARAATTPVEPNLRPFYTQHADWTPCPPPAGSPAQPQPPAATCATLQVPLDYAHPGAHDTLPLAVSRIPATGPGPRLGSLVLNFGGPGISGVTELADRAAGSDDLAELNKHYDLVGFDPRGVGRSAPVTCGDLSGQTAADVARSCRRLSGWLLPWVGTTNAARDMDVLRQVLGDDRLTYLGFSYGSKLGAVYAHEFPQRVGRMVLDGVPDPTTDDPATALAQAAAFQRAAADFAADCAARGCPVPGRTGAQVLAGVSAQGDDLARTPLTTSTGTLDRAAYLRGIQNALYSRDTWPYLRQALGDVRRGDGSLMMQLADPTPGSRAPRAAGDNVETAKLAVDCRDSSQRPTPATLRALDARFAAASPLFGSAIEASLLACTGWPPGDDSSRDVAAPTAPQILLVSTTRDPATPYGGARHMAEKLRNGSPVLTHHGDGHTAYFAHDACVTAAVDGFLENGTLPRGDC